MIDGVTGDLSEEEMQVLVKALSRLDDWFREKEEAKSVSILKYND